MTHVLVFSNLWVVRYPNFRSEKSDWEIPKGSDKEIRTEGIRGVVIVLLNV